MWDDLASPILQTQTASPLSPLLQFRPSDRAICLLLLLASITAAITHGRPHVPSLLVVHLSLLVAYLVFIVAAARWSQSRWVGLMSVRWRR